MFEHKYEPPVSHPVFLRHLRRHGGYAFSLIGGSLVIGMLGYHLFANQGWVDAFLNTTMLLGGMGPIGDLPNDTAKIFAGLFALYSGLVFLAVAILLLTPVFHRILHKFHAEVSSKQQ